MLRIDYNIMVNEYDFIRSCFLGTNIISSVLVMLCTGKIMSSLITPKTFIEKYHAHLNPIIIKSNIIVLLVNN